MQHPRFQSWCQRCIWQLHPTMMTGYCLRSSTCDRCGYLSDLAMVDLKENTQRGGEK